MMLAIESALGSDRESGGRITCAKAQECGTAGSLGLCVDRMRQSALLLFIGCAELQTDYRLRNVRTNATIASTNAATAISRTSISMRNPSVSGINSNTPDTAPKFLKYPTRVGKTKSREGAICALRLLHN